jgi:pyrimidine operon attenuation protein/uracil phosphoribosyltransferase
MGNKVKILDQEAIRARLRRMAFEIYESYYQEKKLIVIGIDQRGGYLATELCRYLEEVSPLEIHLVNTHVDRSDPSGSIGIEIPMDIEDIQDQPVLVVDDVVYSGRTMLNVVAILLQAGARIIHTAVLIDRGHRTLPVSCDYVGMELATTIQQHVSVEIDESEGRAEVFLL